jgi:hypothetical protein
MTNAIEKFNQIIDRVEARCMATDGPVTPALREMRENELRDLWRCVQKIRLCIKEIQKSDAPLKPMRKRKGYGLATPNEMHRARVIDQRAKYVRPGRGHRGT